MSTDDSFAQIIAGLEAGDQDAAAEIVNRFAGRLIGVARNRLDARVKQKVDPEDVLQSAFRSFFLRQADKRFEIDGWDSLWGMLVVITLRKCGRKINALYTARRDISREQNILSGHDGSSGHEAVGREPTPEEAAKLSELVERVMSELNERERTVFSMRLQGYTVPEISEQVGRTERTVHRFLEKVRKLISELDPVED